MDERASTLKAESKCNPATVMKCVCCLLVFTLSVNTKECVYNTCIFSALAFLRTDAIPRPREGALSVTRAGCRRGEGAGRRRRKEGRKEGG